VNLIMEQQKIEDASTQLSELGTDFLWMNHEAVDFCVGSFEQEQSQLAPVIFAETEEVDEELEEDEEYEYEYEYEDDDEEEEGDDVDDESGEDEEYEDEEYEDEEYEDVE